MILSKINFITSNHHKFDELQAYFESKQLGKKYELLHLKQKYTELQADTIKEVALGSASSLATIIEGDFLIEDSGISVSALKNFPGPYSSYIFQTLGCSGILDLMKSQVNREAFFTSVFVLSYNNNLFTFEGRSEGYITDKGIGNDGFGFDPIFIPKHQKNGLTKTLAQMDMNTKNRYSHRGKSLDKLYNFLQNQ